LEKAQTRKIKASDPGKNADPFSIFNSFQPSHFVNVARACGIEMEDVEGVIPDMISIMEAQEKAQTMLNEARIREEKEIQMEKEREMQLVTRDGSSEMGQEERGDDEKEGSSSDEDLEESPRKTRVDA
jgi:hypothetical protein